MSMKAVKSKHRTFRATNIMYTTLKRGDVILMIPKPFKVSFIAMESLPTLA